MYKNRYITLMIIILLLFFNTTIAFASEHEIINDDTVDKIAEFKDEINFISNIIIGFSAVSSVLIFIIHFIRLAGAQNNPTVRGKVLGDIMITGICTSLIGAIGIISKIYINIFA